MKKYFKVFVIAFVATLLVVGTFLAIYIPLRKAGYEAEMKRLKEQERFLNEKTGKKTGEEKADLNTLNGLISVSKRLNVLVLGIDGGRTDTIIVLSYDYENKLMDLITVPRDTYHWVPGYDALDQRKINAVFGFGEEDGGGRGCKAEISQLLGIPIHYYVITDYNAVSDIVDTVGGVDVMIEEPMHYDDIMSDPPLHIHFDPGPVTLDGQSAIEYLRWRKNNGEYGAGDIPRTGRQMGFVKQLLGKALSSFKFDKLVDTCYKYVSTDMPLSEAIYYATTLFGFDLEQGLVSHTLPGESIFDGLSYYAHDPKKTENLMMGIYRKRDVADNKKPIELGPGTAESPDLVETEDDEIEYEAEPEAPTQGETPNPTTPVTPTTPTPPVTPTGPVTPTDKDDTKEDKTEEAGGTGAEGENNQGGEEAGGHEGSTQEGTTQEGTNQEGTTQEGENGNEGEATPPEDDGEVVDSVDE